MVHQYHHSDSAEGSQISNELRHHQYGQARQELTSELHNHPRDFQHLLHQISNDLIAHHYKPLSIEHDRHNNITGINFHHHNIYGGFGQETQEPHRRHRRGEEESADTSQRPIRHHGRPRDQQQEQQQEQQESFEPPFPGRTPSRELQPGEHRNPFVDLAHDIEKGVDRTGKAIGDGLNKFGDDVKDAAEHLGGNLERLSREAGDKLANLAVHVAGRLRTFGDCAHGPRVVLDEAGIHLPPMMATEQGRHIRNSGYFDEVSPHDVRRGDYGVRNWSNHVIRQHGYNAGDSFIVSSVHNGHITQANDHIQGFDTRGRYADAHFYRLNARGLAKLRENGFV